jgi:hypothetical protein
VLGKRRYRRGDETVVWRGLAPRRIQRLPRGCGLYTSPLVAGRDQRRGPKEGRLQPFSVLFSSYYMAKNGFARRFFAIMWEVFFQ